MQKQPTWIIVFWFVDMVTWLELSGTAISCGHDPETSEKTNQKQWLLLRHVYKFHVFEIKSAWHSIRNIIQYSLLKMCYTQMQEYSKIVRNKSSLSIFIREWRVGNEEERSNKFSIRTCEILNISLGMYREWLRSCRNDFIEQLKGSHEAWS
jgi:hypothetical protein